MNLLENINWIEYDNFETIEYIDMIQDNITIIVLLPRWSYKKPGDVYRKPPKSERLSLMYYGYFKNKMYVRLTTVVQYRNLFGYSTRYRYKTRTYQTSPFRSRNYKNNHLLVWSKKLRDQGVCGLVEIIIVKFQTTRSWKYHFFL